MPEEQFAWGSQSTRRTLSPSRARQAARLMAVVVLPTPPFWLTRPRILPMGIQSKGKRSSGIAALAVENPANLWKAAPARRGENPANLCRRWGLKRSARQFSGLLQKNSFGGKLP